MKVIKIALYSLTVVLLAQTFIISCPTCFKQESSKQNPSGQAGGNGGQNVIGEMGKGSNQSSDKKTQTISIFATQSPDT